MQYFIIDRVITDVIKSLCWRMCNWCQTRMFYMYVCQYLVSKWFLAKIIWLVRKKNRRSTASPSSLPALLYRLTNLNNFSVIPWVVSRLDVDYTYDELQVVVAFQLWYYLRKNESLIIEAFCLFLLFNDLSNLK